MMTQSLRGFGVRGLGDASFSYQFTPSRGENRAYQGDSYRVSIAGAAPFTNVVVQTKFQGNQAGPAIVGQTDAGGGFVSAGRFTADQIGDWDQFWYVGDTYVGRLAFLVTSPPIGSPEWQVLLGGSVPQEVLSNPSQLPAYTPDPLPTPVPVSQTYNPVLTQPSPTPSPATNPTPVSTPTTTPTTNNPVPISTPAPTTTTGDLIPGVENKYLLMGGGALLLLLAMKGR